MLWVLPLEPLEERYTIQWWWWFEKELHKLWATFKFVPGDKLTDVIERGSFLDIVGTNYWKSTQMARVCKLFQDGLVRDGDGFFTFDLWHPGLEAIPYMAQLSGIRVDVYGYLFAGSYIDCDFIAPLNEWARHFEQGWAQFCRKVFVATEYHRDLFARKRYFCDPRVQVVGSPFDAKEVSASVVSNPFSRREKIVIFPHRWDTEKQPVLFLWMMQQLWEQRKDFRIVITTSRPKMRSNSPELIAILEKYKQSLPITVKVGLSKQQYYHELAQARVCVSTALEETFGYCQVEAACLGCVPISPDRLSYPEVFDNDRRLLYSDDYRAVDLINAGLDSPIDARHYAVKYQNSISMILEMMRENWS